MANPYLDSPPFFAALLVQALQTAFSPAAVLAGNIFEKNTFSSRQVSYIRPLSRRFVGLWGDAPVQFSTLTPSLLFWGLTLQACQRLTAHFCFLRIGR